MQIKIQTDLPKNRTKKEPINPQEIAVNIILAILFLKFARSHLYSMMDTFRLSTLLLLIKVTTDVVFYLIRRSTKKISFSFYDWLIALAGTYAIIFFRPSQGHDLFIGQILQLSGVFLQIIAMISLNRSIGIVPANRGVQTGGLYRFVRHPLYFSYAVAFLGYTINHSSFINIVVYIVALLLWILRLLAEERFLLQDETYRSYTKKVNYRIFPGVF